MIYILWFCIGLLYNKGEIKDFMFLCYEKMLRRYSYGKQL